MPEPPVLEPFFPSPITCTRSSYTNMASDESSDNLNNENNTTESRSDGTMHHDTSKNICETRLNSMGTIPIAQMLADVNVIKAIMRMKNQADYVSSSTKEDSCLAGPSREYNRRIPSANNMSITNVGDKHKLMSASSSNLQTNADTSNSGVSLDALANRAILNEMQCRVCHMRFNSLSLLMIHIRSHYSKSRKIFLICNLVKQHHLYLIISLN